MNSLISLQRTKIKPEDYLKIIENEYNQIKVFLPMTIKSVLDIGCGLGGIDIFLYRNYKPKITFLDRDGIDANIKYGYNKNSNKYNLISETKSFVERYGVRNAKYLNIDKEQFPDEKFDLTISLYAMGYHFPFDKYVPKTKYLIADIRNGQFMPDNGQLITEGKNSRRMIWQNF